MGGQLSKEVKASSFKQKSDKPTRTSSRLLTATDIFNEPGGMHDVRVVVLIVVYAVSLTIDNTFGVTQKTAKSRVWLQLWDKEKYC